MYPNHVISARNPFITTKSRFKLHSRQETLGLLYMWERITRAKSKIIRSSIYLFSSPNRLNRCSEQAHYSQVLNLKILRRDQTINLRMLRPYQYPQSTLSFNETLSSIQNSDVNCISGKRPLVAIYIYICGPRGLQGRILNNS